MDGPETPVDRPESASTPSAAPVSRAERRARARAIGAVNRYRGTEADKRDAHDAAAGLRRARAGGSGRVTPKAQKRARGARR